MCHQEDKKVLLEDWDKQFKVTMKELEHKIIKNNNTVVNVNHSLDLNSKEFVSFSELSQDLKVIEKNWSAIFVCNDRIVGRVVRNAALKKVSEFFRNKIKSIIDKHYTILREKEHGSSGKLVGHSVQKELLGLLSGPYAYRKIKGKKSSLEEQRIYNKDGDTVVKWLYDNAKTDIS